METLAYLHLACENELPDDIPPARESIPFKLNWQKFSSVTCIQVLSLGVSIAIAGFTSSAMAQSGILQQGDQGAAVIELQDRLRAAGCFEGSSTGFFGAQTREAVIRCQERFGLTPDGIAGKATLNALARGSDIPTNGTSTVSFGNSSFGDILQFGDEGAAVSQLQQRLQDLGYYYGEIDGVFGSETQRAVLQFQRDRGLTEDGIVGAQVYAALRGNGTPTPPIGEVPSTGGELTIGDTGARVTALQQRLNSAGYPVVVDGIYGENTRSAVIAFQRDRGLPPTGTADSQTLAALGVPDVGGIPQRNRYVVIIPTPDRAALAKVQTVFPTAVARTDRRGNYVQAGAFATPEEADRRTQLLRSRGLDARVIFQ